MEFGFDLAHGQSPVPKLPRVPENGERMKIEAQFPVGRRAGGLNYTLPCPPPDRLLAQAKLAAYFANRVCGLNTLKAL